MNLGHCYNAISLLSIKLVNRLDMCSRAVKGPSVRIDKLNLIASLSEIPGIHPIRC